TTLRFCRPNSYWSARATYQRSGMLRAHPITRIFPASPCSVKALPLFSLPAFLIGCTLPANSTTGAPMHPAPACAPSPPPPRLLDLVRQTALARFGQDGPGQRFADWTRRLVLFHDKRHPRDLSPCDVRRFLEHVAQTKKDPLNRLEEAHTALSFLYHDVLAL